MRGAAIAQVGTSIAMASVMFGLILHFQYAYGWSPVRAGLANLPLIVTMIAATPVSEWLARRFGHRIACLVGAALIDHAVEKHMGYSIALEAGERVYGLSRGELYRVINAFDSGFDCDPLRQWESEDEVCRKAHEYGLKKGGHK